MSGEQVKEKIKPLGISINELGRRLGMSSSLICQTLDAKDIKTGVLERICEALGVDMSFFYPVGSTNNTTNNIHKQSAHNISNGSGDIHERSNADMIRLLIEQNSSLIKMLQEKNG